jgi:hypothetical protein
MAIVLAHWTQALCGLTDLITGEKNATINHFYCPYNPTIFLQISTNHLIALLPSYKITPIVMPILSVVAVIKNLQEGVHF